MEHQKRVFRVSDNFIYERDFQVADCNTHDNAVFLAAAPVLLAELKAVRELLAQMPAPGNWSIVVDQKLRVIDSVVAIAEKR